MRKFMIEEKVKRLLEQGYKPYRYIGSSTWNKDSYQYFLRVKEQSDVIFEDDKGIFIETKFYSQYLRQNFNTQVNGGTSVILSKDKEFNNYFIVGLREKDTIRILEI